MNVFFAELNILAVSIIGVLLSVVVPEIMLNVTPRKVQESKTQLMSKVNKERHPREGHLNEQRFAENLQALVVLTFGT